MTPHPCSQTPTRRAGARQPTGDGHAQQKEHAMPAPADREKALESALAQIDRQFGKGSVMRLGSDERAPVAVIQNGSIAIDVAPGVGGIPPRRTTEIYAPESSGKTTLNQTHIANDQPQGDIAATIDHKPTTAPGKPQNKA